MFAEHKKLIKRYENNPILTKDDIPYPVQTVHNNLSTGSKGITMVWSEISFVDL